MDLCLKILQVGCLIFFVKKNTYVCIVYRTKTYSVVSSTPHHERDSNSETLVVGDIVKSRQPAIFVGNCPFLARYFSMSKKNGIEKSIFRYTFVYKLLYLNQCYLLYQIPFGNPS